MHRVWKKTLTGVNLINNIKIIKTEKSLSVFCFDESKSLSQLDMEQLKEILTHVWGSLRYKPWRQSVPRKV